MDNKVLRLSAATLYPISDTLEPYLDMKAVDFIRTPAAFGMNKMAFYGGFLPPLGVMEKYIEAHNFSEETLTKFYSSDIYNIMQRNGSGNYSLCCDEATISRSGIVWYTTQDIMSIATQPHALSHRDRTDHLTVKCSVHDKSQIGVPVIIFSPIYNKQAPLKLNDILVTSGERLRFAAMESTVLEVINVAGIDVNKCSLFTRFNAPFGSETEQYVEATNFIKEIAPYGEQLAWMLLCAYNANSFRSFTSRIPSAKELINSIGISKTWQYLDAGISNIKEISFFVKKEIEPAVVAHAYSLGITKAGTIAKLHREGVDLNIMSGLLNKP